MSKLAKDAAAFKATMQRQNFTSWHSQQQSQSDASSSNTGAGLPNAEEAPPSHSPKKKRPKSSMLALSSLFV